MGGCRTEFKRGGWGGRSVIAGKFMLVVRHHSNNDMELKNIMFLFIAPMFQTVSEMYSLI